MVSGKVLKERQHGRRRHHYSGGGGGLEWQADDEARASSASVVTSLDRTLVQKWMQEQIEAVLSDRWTDFAQSLNGEKWR